MEQATTKVDLGWVAGLSLATLFMLAGIAGCIWGLRNLRSDHFAAPVVFLGAVVAVAAVVMFTAGAWPPFNMDYHQYRSVHGTVAEVQDRFLGGEHGSTQLFAVRLAGSDQVYRCDDTRCSLLKPGDEVWLWCKREWQQASTPGFVCNFDRAEVTS